jgi:poly-beta-1,6-N-acetyl-D-glucosamine synthase
MPRYVVITPARDEEEHIEKTLNSMIAQTIRPVQWIVVNDGSSDATGSILDRYAHTHPWITALHRPDRGFRQAGTGVIHTFYFGYDHLHTTGWDYLVKLDADLSFEPKYFERCFAEFEKDSRLGIAGGGIYHLENGTLKLEPHPLFHVRGATKIYRRECWEQLAGLIRAPGWDTVDELKANMLGWRTRTFAEFPLVHHRITGAADGTWRDALKNGRANYVTGYHPLFLLLKVLKRLPQRPYVLGSLGLLWGYLTAAYKRVPQVDDAALIAYTRRQQLRRLLFLDSIWQ